ncbi:unnamed protein product [Thelazia callipaeda]|uniref:Tyrosinase_Cu-bd domain-containing protein n=1 Tax=Thelazia callipaeda TaxID=103827 RepID=A0A158RAT2_THECL|nr:unnamed protein product [Thelazia callipaeda]
MLILPLITLLTKLSYSTGAQFKLKFAFCNQAPNPALQLICSQFQKWDSEARQLQSDSRTRTSWSSGRVWSSSRSRWSAGNMQNWAAWTAWSAGSSHQHTSQSIHEADNHHKPQISINNRYSNNNNHYNFSKMTSLTDGFTSATFTQQEPKRKLSLSVRTETNRVRGGQITNVRTYSRTSSTSTSLSTASSRRERILIKDNENFDQVSRTKQMPHRSSIHESKFGKDLYSMEQDMVGPPGQQRPSNFIFRNKQRTSVPSPSPSPSPPPVVVNNVPEKFSGSKSRGSLVQETINQRDPSRVDELSVEERMEAMECMDLNCLCSYFHGLLTNSACYLSNGKKLSKAVRKEYRQLLAEERRRFHSALLKLKQIGDYDRIAKWHSQPEISGGAHSGPAFLPWHREYIKRMEIALRLVDPEVSLPYWDSTLESGIPNGKDTILFSKTLMGDSDKHGDVISGFMSRWFTPERRYVNRQVAQQGRTFKEDDIQAIMRHHNVISMLAYTAPKQGCRHPINWAALEYSQANVLVWVGGDSFHQTTCANDPLIFLHYAFVDSIWEWWRQHRQSSGSRSTSYPPDSLECSNENHFAQNPMQPFEPLKNIDGISNKYTDEMYKYAPRPACKRGRDGLCASEFLFCDSSHGSPRCSTKIRPGGRCDGYSSLENPCYNSTCISSTCSQEIH